MLDFQKLFAGKILTIDFELFDQKFTAINAGNEFTFNEEVSFNIGCKSQAEIDYYWNAMAVKKVFVFGVKISMVYHGKSILKIWNN